MKARDPVRFDSSAELADRLMHVAYLLDLTDAELARILGVDPLFVLDLHAHRARPDLRELDAGRRAAQLVGLYEALSRRMSRWSEVRRWFDAPNDALGDCPRALAQSAPGLHALTGHVDPAAAG